MKGPCRGFNTREEEAKHYHSLTPEQQRHWRIEGHAYMLSLRLENRGKNPVENWLQAEAEIQREKDLHNLWREKSTATDRNRRAFLSATYYLAYGTKTAVATINNATPLPDDEEKRQLLCRNVAEELIAEPLILPQAVQNIGELVAFVIANYRQRQPPQHRLSHRR